MNTEKLRSIIEDIFGDGHEYKQGQFKVNCIAPNCSDKSANLEINIDQGVFHCWKCGYKGKILKLFKDILGKEFYIDVEEEYVSAEELKKVVREGPFFAQQKQIQKTFSGLPQEFTPLWGDPQELTLAGRKALEYALTRMSWDDISRYRVGYCGLGEYKWRLIVPIFEGKEVVYFVGRAIFRNMPPYKNSNFPKKHLLFNYEKAIEVGKAVLVEGAFDAIRVGDGPVVGVASLGTQLTDEQVYKLNLIPDLTIMLDQDAKNKTYELQGKLFGRRHKTKLLVLPHGDPDNFSREELQSMLSRAKVPDLEEALFLD
jgi:DNA primase